EVKLGIARHTEHFLGQAEGKEVLPLALVLAEDQVAELVELLHGPASQAALVVQIEPRVGQHHGDAALPALALDVGPQLGLGGDVNVWAQALKIAPADEMQIGQREIEQQAEHVAELFLRHGLAGVSGGHQHNLRVGLAGFQFADQRSYRHNL